MSRTFPIVCALLGVLSLAAVPPSQQSTDPNLLKSTEPLRERDPARAVLFQGRGIQFVNDGKCEAAAEQFRRAAAFDPGNASIYINLAYCLDKLGRYDQAIAELKRAQDLAPSNSMIYVHWGNSLINMKKFEDALEPLRTATVLDASNLLEIGRAHV